MTMSVVLLQTAIELCCRSAVELSNYPHCPWYSTYIGKSKPNMLIGSTDMISASLSLDKKMKYQPLDV